MTSCAVCATAAFWLSYLLVPLYVFMTCSLCWAAKGIHGQDKTVLVQMMPMGSDMQMNVRADTVH